MQPITTQLLQKHLHFFPIKPQLCKETMNGKGRRSGSWRREKSWSDRKTEAKACNGGWQALLSAESDMAVGDRWQNQKVMSLLTGSACAPLISPVPPRHLRSRLRCSLSLLNWQIGWQAERQATGRVWSGTGASGASGMPLQNLGTASLFILLSLSLPSPLFAYTEPL